MPTVQVRALSADPDPAALMEVLAQLDARYAGREATVGAAQWSEYVRRREALREALDRALAARGTRG
jgi:hypothetical protein